MLLADSRVYSTKVGVSCSTDTPWPVRPHPRAVADMEGPRPEAARSSSTTRSQAGTTRSQKRDQKWGRVSRSVTKARTARIHTEQNRMIPRLLFMRPEGRGSFVTDLDTNRPIPSEAPRSHR